MTRCAILCAALLLAAPAAAQDQAVPDPAAGAAGEPLPEIIDSAANPEDFDLAKKKVVDCEGEKFVFAWGAGANPTKVTLCSKEGATADELVRMLDDAAEKLEQTASIAEDRRVAIVQQIRAKIAELKAPQSAAAAPSAVAAAPVSAPAETPPAIASPVPQPAIAAAATPAPARVAARPMVAAPARLSFECYTPGVLGGGSQCITMGRDTRLTVKADEALTGATSIRFVRNGESRSEVALRQMRKGESLRLVLPREMCSGVVEAEAKVEVVRAGQVVDSVGPALLRC